MELIRFIFQCLKRFCHLEVAILIVRDSYFGYVHIYDLILIFKNMKKKNGVNRLGNYRIHNSKIETM